MAQQQDFDAAPMPKKSKLKLWCLNLTAYQQQELQAKLNHFTLHSYSLLFFIQEESDVMSHLSKGNKMGMNIG